MFEQDNGNIWVHGMGLLAYFNPTENRFVNIGTSRFQPNSIEYDMVSNLYEDKEKNVWVCTNNGLYRFNLEAQVFQNISNRRPEDSTIIHNAVSAIVQTKEHGIWVSTWGAGVFSYDKNLQPIPNPFTLSDAANKGMHASYMIERRNGEVWTGTQSGSIKIYDPTADKCFSVTPPALNGETITQLLEDHLGNTWIGTTSGLLVKCEKSNWRDTARSYTRVLHDVTDVMNLYEDRHRDLWVCTTGDGVYRINIANGTVLQQIKEGADKRDGLLNDGATAIIQYNDSIYLIAGDGIAVYNKRSNSFRYLMAARDLPAEQITSLTLDKKNRLWVALDGGLYKLNSIDKRLYVSFGIEDGIINNIFQVSASAVLSDGRVILGTPHDMMVFDPDKNTDTAGVPKVTITGLQIGSSLLNVDSVQLAPNLVLAYDNTYTRIDVSTLHFRDNYSIVYRLEGLDTSWKVAENNAIIFHYLPPGNYILKMRSENGEPDDTKVETALHIHVNAPFWKTWWFYSLLLLLAGYLLFTLDHRRMKRKQAVQTVRSNIADNLHKEISATLDNISVLSEMAKIKASSEPEKSKEFIEQIHLKSQNMTMAMDDILWSIDPGNDNMHSFMLRLNEYIETLRRGSNVSIDLLEDDKLGNLQLSMETRKDIFWLFKGGISSVVRSGGTNNRIHITYEKPWLLYTLEFDTISANMAQINTLRQRHELLEKINALKASIEFKEHTSSAVFFLRIPVKDS